MVYMLIFATLLVAVGPILLFRKMRPRIRAWLLGHAFVLEVVVFVGLLLLHKDTGWGIVLASVAVTFISVGFSILRKLDGYYEIRTLTFTNGKTRTVRVFVPGWLNKEEPK